MKTAKRYQELVELEEKIRVAMLGETPESRIPLQQLHKKVVAEIRAIRGQPSPV